MIFVGSDGQPALTVAPQSKVGVAGENFTLKAECHSLNAITWEYDSTEIVDLDCVSNDARFTSYFEGGDETKCYLSATFKQDTCGPCTAAFIGDFKYIAVVVTLGW